MLVLRGMNSNTQFYGAFSFKQAIMLGLHEKFEVRSRLSWEMEGGGSEGGLSPYLVQVAKGVFEEIGRKWLKPMKFRRIGTFRRSLIHLKTSAGIFLQGLVNSLVEVLATDFLGGQGKKFTDLLVELIVDVGKKLLGGDSVLQVEAGAGDSTCDESPIGSGRIVTKTGFEFVAHGVSRGCVEVMGIDDIKTRAPLRDGLVDRPLFAVFFLFDACLSTHGFIAVLSELVNVVKAEALEVFHEVKGDAGSNRIEVAVA